MDFDVTLRYGRQSQRYHTLRITAPEAATALRAAADRMPEEIVAEVDLVEVRKAPDREKDGSTPDVR
jgi:hypothetical protein